MDKIKVITHDVRTIQNTLYCKEIFHIPEPSQPHKYLNLINLQYSGKSMTISTSIFHKKLVQFPILLLEM